MKPVFPENVNVACVKYPPTCVREFGMDGIDRNLISLLSQALKSNLKLVFPSDNQYGFLLENGTWTGLLGLIIRDEADIAISYLSYTKERAKVADFSEPYSYNYLSIVTNVPQLRPRYLVYLYPFEPSTWFCILSLLFVLPVVLKFLFKVKLDYCRCFLMVLGNLTDQDPYRSRIERSWFVALWWLTSLVISRSFTGLVFSFLTVPLYESPLNSFEDLTKAVRSGTHEVFYRKGSNLPHILEDHWLGHLSKKLQALDPFLWHGRHKDVFGVTKSGREMAFLSFYTEFRLIYGIPLPATKFLSSDPQINTNIGIYVRKGFCCKAALDKAVMKIKRAGLYEKNLDFIAFKQMLRLRSNASLNAFERSFNVQDISGAIFLWACGISLSVLTLIVEIFWKRFLHTA